MGSYAALSFDELSVHEAKSVVPDIFISLFQEADRRVTKLSGEPDEDDYIYRYAAPRGVVLLRLDIMGFTARAAQNAFEHWRRIEIAEKTEWLSLGDDWVEDQLKALKDLSYEEWRARVPSVLRDRYSSEKRKPKDKIEEEMLDASGDGWLFFGASDERLVIRALLDACPGVSEVTLDVSDLVSGGYIDKGTAVCDIARKPDALKRPVLEPVVILAEGSTDIRVLRRSLAALYPELNDYFSFFDHEELSVDGGAGYLIKFLQAFAAAGISSRMVAIFDNDAVGKDACEKAATLPLPSNIKLLRLPDIELAKSYPSVGPQGKHMVDVNGKAASIELYLENIT